LKEEGSRTQYSPQVRILKRQIDPLEQTQDKAKWVNSYILNNNLYYNPNNEIRGGVTLESSDEKVVGSVPVPTKFKRDNK